jgi:signal transduction histidine kinase
MKVSLRGRIAWWYALSIPALVFLVVLTAQQIMVLNLRSSGEDILKWQANEVSVAITGGLGGESESYDEVLERLTSEKFFSIPLLLRIANTSGVVKAEFGEIPEPTVYSLNALLQKPDIHGGRFDTIDIRGFDALRVYTVSVSHPSTGVPIAVVQVGQGLASLTAARQQLWQFTLLVGALGSLGALVIGLLILRQGFRPLDRILKRVQEVESSNLYAGLPREPRPPELQRLAESLNIMWERLDASFRAKQIFLANVSHELRTPLTAVAGQIEVLLMRPSLDPEGRESLERMSKEVRRLIRMTNNLLLNAELETKPPVAHEAVNLRDLIEEVVGDVWVLAQNIDFGASADEDVLVAGDRDLMKQMVLNVVDNAIKFTPPGGRADLVLSKEGNYAVLEVSDSGCGIPSEHLPHLMEPFYKANGRGAAGRGAGLGLAIVKQIVDLHHGEIQILSEQGVGTSVIIWLPIYEAPSPTDTRLEAQAVDSILHR